MITKQRLFSDGDRVVLRNTVSVTKELDATRQINELDAGGYFGDKNERMQLMGFIPPEYWLFDPWLLTANRARKEGDMREYICNLKKFFAIHSAFKVNHKRTMWRGCEAVLL